MAHLAELGEAARKDSELVAIYENVRDLEHWRQLFFDLNIAKMPRLIADLGAWAVRARAQVDPDFARHVERTSPLVGSSREERAPYEQRLGDLERSLRQRGFDDFHPDHIRDHVRDLLRSHEVLEPLVAVHAGMKPTDRFHEHEFGQLVEKGLDAAEVLARSSALSFGQALTRVLDQEGMDNEIAVAVRRDVTLLNKSTDEDERVRGFQSLARDARTRAVITLWERDAGTGRDVGLDAKPGAENDDIGREPRNGGGPAGARYLLR